jgi:non-ribosomal peptide synthetase component F
MMSIEMSGCIYCPLSSRDPQHRLHSLIQQTESRLVLVHCLTSRLLNQNIVTVDIDSMLNNNWNDNIVNVDRLRSLIVLPDSIAYITFTSGSTGIPKAVSVFLI